MKRIGLFCGGYSSEFDISIMSATTIAAHFPKGVELVPIIVEKTGWNAKINGQLYPFSLSTCSYSIESNTFNIDAGLIYIHGNPGENGKIQALLDLHQIPYLNSGALASELSFDKWYCNQFLKSFDVPVAKSLFLQHPEQIPAEEIIKQLGLPLFVKPSDSGSSYGISRVNVADDLPKALEVAFAEGNTVVIESFLDGTEVTCGAYRTENGIHTLPLTEIVSENEFFDFSAKYQGKSQEITPARIPDEQRNQVWETTKKVYQLLQLRSIARIDYMIVNGIPHVIEVNTTPGFSPASLVPQMIAADGNTIEEFWKSILKVELPNFI